MANPAHNPHQNTRDGRGRYKRSPDTAANDARAVELWGKGWTYSQIAGELGINKSNARIAVQRALREVIQGPAEEALKAHIDRLEYLWDTAVDIIESDHVMVSHGQVVKDDSGTPLRDNAPRLAAIREGRATLESLRKLTGLDQPAKVDLSGGVKYEVVGVDPADLT